MTNIPKEAIAAAAAVKAYCESLGLATPKPLQDLAVPFTYGETQEAMPALQDAMSSISALHACFGVSLVSAATGIDVESIAVAVVGHDSEEEVEHRAIGFTTDSMTRKRTVH